MPFIDTGSIKTFYRLEGKPGSPILALSHSIGTDHGMWEPQVNDLIHHFQVLRYDTRGHGASDAPAGDYSIEQLGNDLLCLADGLGIRKFAFCGLSLGGAIGQWLAANAPLRIERLILANTAPRFGSREQWETRIGMVKEGGIAAIVDLAMQRFFSGETLQRGDPRAESIKSLLLGTNPAGYIALLCRFKRLRLERISRQDFRAHAGDCRQARRLSHPGQATARSSLRKSPELKACNSMPLICPIWNVRRPSLRRWRNSCLPIRRPAIRLKKVLQFAAPSWATNTSIAQLPIRTT